MNIESNEIIDQDRKAPFFSGGVRELVRAPHRFFLQLTRDYGDVVQYRATPEQAFLLNHPDYVKHVLVSNGRNGSPFSAKTYNPSGCGIKIWPVLADHS